MALTPSRPTRRRTAPPLFPLDPERVADLRDAADRKVRAMLHDEPYAVLGAALFAGFLVGGGWRTRAGRFVALACARYAATTLVARQLAL